MATGYENGTRVTLLTDGGFLWEGNNYKKVYGVIGNDGSVRLFNKSDNLPASIAGEQPRAWCFLNFEIRKARKQS